MKTTLRMLFATLVLTISNMTASAQTMDSKTLTLEGAKLVIDAAKAEARRVAAPGAVIAVVDNGGNLIALERLDGTFAAGANMSIGKARTAALFKRPTKDFEEIVRSGRTATVALPDSLFTPLQGGIPILVGSEVVGAVAVSGAASAQQDEDLAIAGAKSVTRITKPVTVSYFEKEKVDAGFAKGTVLFDGDKYQVHASRRDKAGVVEIHEKDADIMYVISGTATLVTGGEPVNVSTVSPGEIRATDVKGGESRQISRGDVIVIPAGTPHWFKEVTAPLTYYVVKAR
jgi:uncharacterized protein GlcG (DUF336 family)/mannose-6-phosphate isomerase-like protein (cupin superfamily)